ncbi:UDP-N-acetylglucosamine 2-epimerase (non-hydrolyzing) [Verrucomicrobia bacterium]|nr:UDP-N-acetylglucosamine 2-epimerase (non-hydrolyzing) [Verrucomicrobiota bacterium]
MNIVSIIGARPQFIKAFPLSKALQENKHNEYLIHTGQHYDYKMSKIFFDELSIPNPNLNLEVGSGTHAEQTARMLTGIERALLSESPDIVLIYGDTNSTLAGVLAASKLQIPIAHVESGLRSFNLKMPEEVNRIIADSVSDILFAPTKTAVVNLLEEGKSKNSIFEVGDIMYDAALLASKSIKNADILKKHKLKEKEYILSTIHRAENTNTLGILSNIIKGLDYVGEKYPVIMPIHPRTKTIIDKHQLTKHISQIKFIEPVGYLEMLCLEKMAKLIVTDSGGVQKEAYFNKTPCVTLRGETEWIELIESGWNTLCFPDSAEKILENVMKAMYREGSTEENLYGSGDTALKIEKVLNSF